MDLDAELMALALDLSPDLKMTAILAQSLRAKLEFPIQSRDVLMACIPENGISALGRTFTRRDVTQYFHDSVYPIPDMHALMLRIYGNIAHAHVKELANVLHPDVTARYNAS